MLDSASIGMIAAMVVTAVVATRPGVGAGTRTVVFLVMLAVMVIGGMLTLRDWSRPRRRR